MKIKLLIPAGLMQSANVISVDYMLNNSSTPLLSVPVNQLFSSAYPLELDSSLAASYDYLVINTDTPLLPGTTSSYFVGMQLSPNGATWYENSGLNVELTGANFNAIHFNLNEQSLTDLFVNFVAIIPAPLTIQQLQARLVAQSNAEAANTVAMMEAIVDGRMGLASVNMADVVAKVDAINSLDVQELQTLSDLVARVVALETASAAHGTAISGLQDSLTTLQNTLVNRIAAVETNVSNLTATVASAATQAGNFVTRDELSSDAQIAAQTFIDTLWAGKTRPHGLPNADGTVS